MDPPSWLGEFSFHLRAKINCEVSMFLKRIFMYFNKMVQSVLTNILFKIFVSYMNNIQLELESPRKVLSYIAAS